MNLSFLLAVFCFFQLDANPLHPPASPRNNPAPVDPAVFAEAVTKLHEIGVISDPEFWLTNVKPGKFIDSTQVQEVIMAGAGKFETVDSVTRAIDVLEEKRVFLNAEKWRAAVQKPKVASGDVIILLTSMAKAIN